MNQPSPSLQPVSVRREALRIPTYNPARPDKNPMFLDKRVYQGSSGKVYPLPFIDRIAEERADREWDAIHLENEFIRLTILPEIGGRIHMGHDKTNGYDFLYRQEVIKPALVGVTGPWISGGIEFNWPQHHRPSTFMPTDVKIEKHADGSITVWLSEHEPMNRMKGMHGICLHPGKALIEIKARVHNRTENVQTFLWWANIATRVHGDYQAFFPTDVTYVADHAKRSMSEFPLCQGKYYGVDYAWRAQSKTRPNDPEALYQPNPNCVPNDLSWYANIPVPTSYMCMDTGDDFFGGYDHKQQAGLVHVANHHISPGKKLWTWGNHAFGYAWDRQLTDPDAKGEYAPYIELMAGVYTDNQPDFSFLAPGEAKTWTQTLYPIQQIGVPQQANLDAAVSLTPDGEALKLAVAATQTFESAHIEVRRQSDKAVLLSHDCSLSPSKPVFVPFEASWEQQHELEVRVTSGNRELIRYTPKPAPDKPVPPAAAEPPLPETINSNEQLYLTGLHLHQYRHATRKPEDYWREALRRDEGDARANNAMGLWHLRRGEFETAEEHFNKAIQRLTELNPNPYDGEPYYNLGLCLRHLKRHEEAYAAFHKAVWNHAWQAPGYFALAELDCRLGHWESALEHLERSLRMNADHLKARCLRAMVLRQIGHGSEAESDLRENLRLDPLDAWSRYLLNGEVDRDPQTALDLALDLARAGFHRQAINRLEAQPAESASDPRALGTQPLIHYYLGWLQLELGELDRAKEAFAAAVHADPDYCFPARLEEIAILQKAIETMPGDSRASYYLGNLLYDRNRREEAIALWERSAELEPGFAITWRNLGIARYNVQGDAEKAREAYDRALAANPKDARILYERDQLWKRLGEKPGRRLQALESHLSLVQQRDDLSIELCALYNQMGSPEKALAILQNRTFQPWEGGEGQVLAQYVRCQLALGQNAIAAENPRKAREHFEAALQPPENLSETNHLLANQSDIYYWLGCACQAEGDAKAAQTAWQKAASFRGDFQEMSVRSFSEMTYFSALAMRRLGQTDKADALLGDLLEYAKELSTTEAKIDYFATSLPTMLVFNDDIQFRQDTMARFLQAQAELGLGHTAEAKSLLNEVLARDPNHPLASDLMQSV
ncbi:MAG: DUF5107 domain-containing protein [Opitutales bacterium]|nr:DUF5107 domain-containing protein [Opitutales bacterium]